MRLRKSGDRRASSRAAGWRFLCFALSLLTAEHTAAQARQAPRGAREPMAEEASYHCTIGVRGFAGALFARERAGIGGAGLLAAVPFSHERYEAELSLGAAASGHETLGLAELTLKRVFELRRAWSPYLLLGPVFSLDFHGGVTPSGGIIVGTGVTYWFHDRFGLVAGLVFRALFGQETREVLTLSTGLSLRI